MEIGDILEVRAYCSAGDQTAINVQHYEVLTKVGLGVDSDVIASAMCGQLATAYKAILNNNAKFNGVGVQRIRPLPIGASMYSNDGAGVGEGANDMLPGQVSGIITKKTALGGKKYRGRMYVPFPSEANSDANGIPSDAYVSLLDDLALAWFQDVTATSGGDNNKIRPRLYHKSDHSLTALTQQYGKKKFATQRRRGAFGRPNESPV